MTDAADTSEALATGSYEGRKSGVRAPRERGVEVQVRPVRRREWPDADKLRIVRESLEPGVVVQAVADRHGISTGLLYTWRKRMLAATVTGFAPVAVVPEAVPAANAPVPGAPTTTDGVPAGTVEVAFPSGVAVRVAGRVEPEVLRGVLAELVRR
jgi:transposase